MSIYNRNYCVKFIEKNYDKLKTLKKFMECNNNNDINEKMKLTKNDVKTILNEFDNNIIYYEPNKLVTFSAGMSKKKIDNKSIPLAKDDYEQVLNYLTNKTLDIDHKKYELYELFWNNSEHKRSGTMSMSSCSNISDKSRQQIVPKGTSIVYDKYVTNTSAIPEYFGNNLQYNSKIVKFKNKLKVSILNCNADNYIGRYVFRKKITEIILGDDYNFDIQNNETYMDGSLGQEVIYYFLEIYNYDRFNELNHIYHEFLNKNLSVNTNISFENFYNDKLINKIYPSIDGVYYYDQNKFIDKNRAEYNIHGTEIVIFTPDLCMNLYSVHYFNILNDKITFKDTKTLDEQINNLKNLIDNYDNLNKEIPMSIESFNVINEKMLKEC